MFKLLHLTSELANPQIEGKVNNKKLDITDSLKEKLNDIVTKVIEDSEKGDNKLLHLEWTKSLPLLTRVGYPEFQTGVNPALHK